MADKKFTWMDLLKVVNELPDEFLDRQVVIWWEDNEGGAQVEEVMRLEEDYHEDGGGCGPVSSLKDSYVHGDYDEPFEELHPIVLKKDHPILIVKYPE